MIDQRNREILAEELLRRGWFFEFGGELDVRKITIGEAMAAALAAMSRLAAERDEVVKAAQNLIDNSPIGDDDRPYISECASKEFDELVRALKQPTPPQHTKAVCSVYHSRAVGVSCTNCGHPKEDHNKPQQTEEK